MAEKAPRRRGLGMGLSALFGEVEGREPEGGAPRPPQQVPIEFLQPSPMQPRRTFAEAELDALAQSLREHGVLQPLLVRPSRSAGGIYEIVAGERRWRAAQLAGLAELPVVVRELGDAAALEIALVENVQREDLTPIEEAQAFRRLIDEFGHTQDALAQAVGKSRSHVANTLRLLALPEAVRLMLEAGEISAGHARALLGTAEPERLARMVLAEGLSVRQAEALARAKVEQKTRPTPAPDPNAKDLEGQLSGRLGLKVAIRSRGRGGVMTLRWSDHAQLQLLLDRLG